MKTKRLIALALAAVLALGLTACTTPNTTVDGSGSGSSSTGGTSQSGTTEKIFRYSNVADTATIDPKKVNAVADATISYHIYEGLYRNVLGDLQPGMGRATPSATTAWCTPSPCARTPSGATASPSPPRTLSTA